MANDEEKKDCAVNNWVKFFLSLFIFLGAAFFYISWEYGQMRNFREASQYVAYKRIFQPSCIFSSVKRDEKVVEAIHISGSAYPNLSQLRAYFEEKNVAPEQVYIFNLKHKPIYYIGDHQLEWYGYDLKSSGLKNVQYKTWYKRIWVDIQRAMWEKMHNVSIPALIADGLHQEKEEMQKLGYQYFEPLPKGWLYDHRFIDSLIAIYETIPEGAYIHFHCARGSARTTTMMLLYDIFKHGHQESLDAIVQHHYCIGGEKIMNTEVWKRGTWSQQELEARKSIIESFYAYMNDKEAGYGIQSFSAWEQSKKS